MAFVVGEIVRCLVEVRQASEVHEQDVEHRSIELTSSPRMDGRLDRRLCANLLGAEIDDRLCIGCQ